MKMTSSSVFIISLLLLSILVHEAQGIRLDKNGSLSTTLHKFQEDILRSLRRRSLDLEGTNLRCNGKNSCLESSSSSSSGIFRNRRLQVSSVRKQSHHWLPSIHEDYYGPKIHSPRHH